MIKVLFICHGNICRSPMAEFLLKDMIKKEGLADRFVIASAGTSREEIGNPVHQGTRKKLAQKNWFVLRSGLFKCRTAPRIPIYAAVGGLFRLGQPADADPWRTLA